MKNSLIYHLIANVPLVTWIVVYYLDLVSSPTFIIIGSIYAFTYLPIVDYYRFKALKIAQKEDVWKMWGGFRFRYMKEMFFGSHPNSNPDRT